jgi:transcriptional regulator with XRE-family HTH domain
MYPNLKLEIFKRGLRQNHLAREVGINEVVLSKIIRGFRAPSASQRSLLAGYLKVDENWLFEKYDGYATSQPAVPPAAQDGKGQEP